MHTYISFLFPAYICFLPFSALSLQIFPARLQLASNMAVDTVSPHPDPADSEYGWNENLKDLDATPRYADPFGDEGNAEVQYKTMEWW